ncbi:hypothetical protein NE235_15390 [Actinoallomurus spadix]|uniref:Uncharacterized protein n=1 Tax=Actinoallomurus spadix TaxID=79912 RepID=A0ABN0VTK8_9ACTN|nr:hypothetical protein [Actinoallomurus spadix]MCO5987485.1 hypothetical protein [Actinoallomurus spadix]
MTTPPGDDSLPEADAVPPPRTEAERVRAAAPDPASAPDGTTAPRPPQAWFTPPQVPPTPEQAEPAPQKSLGEYLGVLLIGAASLLLLSIFLPWTTWRTPDFGRSIFTGLPATRGQSSYGLAEPHGQIILLAGMVALGLALAGRAVHERFIPYAAIPGALGLLAVFHRGMTLGDAGVTESITWGFWVAVLASVAVLALGLAALARGPQPPRS